MRNIKIYVVVIGLILFTALGISSVVSREHQIKLQNIEIQDTATKLRILDEKYQKLNEELEHKTKTIKQVEEERKKLEQEKKLLQEQLSARQEAKRLAGLRITPVATASSGVCSDWIASAGITDVNNANELISRESGCNPYARNSSSGACGVAQELPCGKSGCALGDGACQIKWMNSYVIGRYGSWANAVAFHSQNSWY